MASLAFTLGMIPGTEKVEKADDQLRADYVAYRDYDSSEELKHFLDLEKEVTSNEFAQQKKEILKEKYKTSKEAEKEKQFNSQKRKVKGDELPDELAALEKEIESDAFQKRKKYLQMSPKERYATTKAFKKEEEYNNLKKSEKVIWYFKTRKKYPFKEIEKWEETFNESFEEGRLSTKYWMNRYFWGDAILDEPYTMADDKSFPTDGRNLEFADGIVKLVARKEEIEGKKWDPVHGFLQDAFDYSSALISTGKGFKQKYGLFKAKIKMASSDLTQAFWMVSEGLVPHIDVAKYEKGKMYSNFFWKNEGAAVPSRSITKTGGNRFTNNFHIFSLEWSPEYLIWKINDKVFKKQGNNVPQEEMYLVFSTILKNWGKDAGLPAGMEIDWVRVYKRKEEQ